MMNTTIMKFTLPEHISYVLALGFACGLSSGIVSPAYQGQMPTVAPVHAKGPISTNDPTKFMKLFVEGHELGFLFGSLTAHELINALNTLPDEWWWPVCISFASERMGVHDDTLSHLDPHIEQGVEKFRQIYQEHFL